MSPALRLRLHLLAPLFAVLLVTAPASQAQWIKHPTPGTPRTRDGKVNLQAPAPRTPQRKPDLSGIWQANEATNEEVKQVLGFTPPTNDSFNGLGEFRGSKYFYDILADFIATDIRFDRNSALPSSNVRRRLPRART